MDRAISDMAAWMDDDRVSLDLACVATTLNSSVAGIVTDLSYGGACITLDAGNPGFPLSELRRIEADELGAFDIIFRWQRGEKIGVSFRSEDAARAPIKAFFEKRRMETEVRSYG